MDEQKVVPNIKEFYIWGYPIGTKWGVIHFVEVKDYPFFILYRELLDKKKEDILKHLYERNIKLHESGHLSISQDEIIKYIHRLRDLSLLEIINLHDEIKKEYNEMFSFFFKGEKDLISKFKTNEELEECKQIIREMNCQVQKKKYDNDEFNEYLDLEEKLIESKQGKITIKSMISTVAVKYKEKVFDLTLYFLNDQFHRILKYKHFDATTIGTPYGGELENFYEEVDLSKNEEEITTSEELKKKGFVIQDKENKINSKER